MEVLIGSHQRSFDFGVAAIFILPVSPYFCLYSPAVGTIDGTIGLSSS